MFDNVPTSPLFWGLAGGLGLLVIAVVCAWLMQRDRRLVLGLHYALPEEEAALLEKHGDLLTPEQYLEWLQQGSEAHRKMVHHDSLMLLGLRNSHPGKALYVQVKEDTLDPDNPWTRGD